MPTVPPAAQSPDGYLLVDSGGGEKLEQAGPYLLVRPSPTAVWQPHLPLAAWGEAVAHFHRNATGGGTWEHRGTKFPRQWRVTVAGLTFCLRLTDFGHIGLFAEQAPNWTWITETCRRLGQGRTEPLKVLNLFAHTGGSTLAAARGGAAVTHLDASRGIVTWAHENADASGLQAAPIRWIVDDVSKFVQRELRRGARYDGIILDPPSFGRGAKGELWKIDESLPPLLADLTKLLSERAAFLLITSHSAGYYAHSFRNLVADMVRGRGGSIEALDLGITATSDGRVLPSGSCARWAAG